MESRSHLMHLTPRQKGGVTYPPCQQHLILLLTTQLHCGPLQFLLSPDSHLFAMPGSFYHIFQPFTFIIITQTETYPKTFNLIQSLSVQLNQTGRYSLKSKVLGISIVKVFQSYTFRKQSTNTKKILDPLFKIY